MNAPAPLAMKINVSECTVRPLLQLDPHVVQAYWQTLHVHDTLRRRMGDLINPLWEDILTLIQTQGRTMYHIVVPQDGEADLAVSDFSVQNGVGNAARVHFGFLPAGLSLKEKLALAKASIDFVFSWPEAPSALIGVTPVSNRAACIFALRSGFKKIAVLPGGARHLGQFEDAMISIYTHKETP